jgi:hypothetical protein
MPITGACSSLVEIKHFYEHLCPTSFSILLAPHSKRLKHWLMYCLNFSLSFVYFLHDTCSAKKRLKMHLKVLNSTIRLQGDLISDFESPDSANYS